MANLKIESFQSNSNLLKTLAAQDENQEWFDFATSKAKVNRSGSDYYQLGDVQLALRPVNQQQWSFYTTKDDQDLTTAPLKIDRDWILKMIAFYSLLE